MNLLAFVYDDYYCYGIESSFRGRYESEAEILASLTGGEHDHQNLEILDADTLSIKAYRWTEHHWIKEDET